MSSLSTEVTLSSPSFAMASSSQESADLQSPSLVESGPSLNDLPETNEVGANGENDTHEKEPPVLPTESPVTPTRDDARQKPSPAHDIVSKRFTRAVNSLNVEINELFSDWGNKLPEDITRQIESLQKLGRNLSSSKNANAPGDSNAVSDSDDEEDKWVCKVQKLSMSDWQQCSWDENDGSYAIKAYYRASKASPDNESGNRADPALSKAPQRVVIHSFDLITELENSTDREINQEAMIIAPPYKFFVENFARIGNRLDQMQSELDFERAKNSDKNSLENPLASESTREEKTLDTGETALVSSSSNEEVDEEHQTPTKQNKKKARKELLRGRAQLQLLYDFIKSDLTYYLDRRSKVREGNVKRVSFDDLWYLFRPGDVIYDKRRRHERLYQIFAVTGGLRRKRNRTRQETADLRIIETKKMERLADSDVDSSDEERIEGRGESTASSGTGTWGPFHLDCFYMGFDGFYVGPIGTHRVIAHFSGEKDITDLPVYPLRCHPNAQQVTAELIDRGSRYINCYGHKSYNGLIRPASRRRFKEKHAGDIFVDHRRFFQDTSEAPQFSSLAETDIDFTQTEEFFSGKFRSIALWDWEVDEQIMDAYMIKKSSFLEPVEYQLIKENPEYLQLFAYNVPAFSFRLRHFVWVDIYKIHEIDKGIKARDTGWEDLVIPTGHRNLLIALVQNHAVGNDGELETDPTSEKPSTQIDLVRGKGRGLVILLHGPPGSGKTSTAETIAAYTQRPLYSITCGDLGVSAYEVERSLLKHMERAHEWGCVLLLDEADVYLTKRDFRDTGRNALVSVFLRQMEYYAGILFLTTNRVGVLDEAFKSRIHVSLSYPRIRLDETRQMWENTLNRIERDNDHPSTNIKIKFKRKKLLNWAESHYSQHDDEKKPTTWNGRQIRNAFQTAIAIARYERELKMKKKNVTPEEAAGPKWNVVKLKEDNFDSIAKTARDFQEYMINVRGTDVDNAREDGLRDDSYEEYHHDNGGGGKSGRGRVKSTTEKRQKDRTKRTPKNKETALSHREESGYLTPSSSVNKMSSPSPSSKAKAKKHGKKKRRGEDSEDSEDDSSSISGAENGSSSSSSSSSDSDD